MIFSFDNAISIPARDAGIQFYKSLPSLPWWRIINRPYFDHLYLHWSVEQWGCLDGNYNAEVDLENGAWVIKLTHPPIDNAIDISDGPYAAHTWHRNSHGFGLAITGMVDATTTDFGQEALQVHELEYLCAAAAAITRKYDLDSVGTNVRNGVTEFNIMTHAEAAIMDGYFPGDSEPSRWDLARVAASDAPLSKDEARDTAAKLRHRIHVYKMAML